MFIKYFPVIQIIRLNLNNLWHKIVAANDKDIKGKSVNEAINIAYPLLFHWRYGIDSLI